MIENGLNDSAIHHCSVELVSSVWSVSVQVGPSCWGWLLFLPPLSWFCCPSALRAPGTCSSRGKTRRQQGKVGTCQNQPLYIRSGLELISDVTFKQTQCHFKSDVNLHIIFRTMFTSTQSIKPMSFPPLPGLHFKNHMLTSIFSMNLMTKTKSAVLKSGPVFCFFKLLSVLFIFSALQRLRGWDDVDAELSEMHLEDQSERAEGHLSVLSLLSQRSLRWQLVSIIIMNMGQQLSGVNAVSTAGPARPGVLLSLCKCPQNTDLSIWNNRSAAVASLPQIYYYADSIYSTAGVKQNDIQYVTVGTGAVNVFMTIAAVGVLHIMVGYKRSTSTWTPAVGN